jgi:hypothetical protein
MTIFCLVPLLAAVVASVATVLATTVLLLLWSPRPTLGSAFPKHLLGVALASLLLFRSPLVELHGADSQAESGELCQTLFFQEM